MNTNLIDKGEQLSKSKLLSFFENNIVNPLRDLFSKSEPEPEINKYQNYADCVIVNQDGDILLLQRSSNDDFMPSKWCLPGGKVEDGESNEAAVIREVMEEVGININNGSLKFLKTIDRNNENNCSHYYMATLSYGQPFLPILDNEEHYRYEFVPFIKLNRYDLLMDLEETLLGMKDQLPISIQPMVEPILDINKAFDEGQISEEDYLLYTQIKFATEIITKAFDDDQVPVEKYLEVIEKSKHYEFVKVTREGKTFYQYRNVGTDQIEEDLPTGEEFETGELGLVVKKYSDKSFLITGETYKNLELLRNIKADVGLGTWNKALNGWIFPANGKEKIMAALAAKMPDGTYEETVAKEAAIELKNSVDVGTTVTIAGGLGVEVKEVTTDEEGKVEYTVEGQHGDDVQATEEEVGIPPADDTRAEELINNATEENRFKVGKELFGKEENEEPVTIHYVEAGQRSVTIEKNKFLTRSGAEVDALDYTNVAGKDVLLSDIETILDKERPYYIPMINEYRFENSGFTLQCVKIEDDKYLVDLNSGKSEFSMMGYRNARDISNSEGFAIMNLETMVATTEYYRSKRKAEFRKQAAEDNAVTLNRYNQKSDEEKLRLLKYQWLSDKQRKTITEDMWNSLSLEEKEKNIPGMKSKPYKVYSPKRVTVLADHSISIPVFKLYSEYVDKDYKRPRSLTAADPCYKEFLEARQLIKYKSDDLELQKEEFDNSYSKGRETSYGDSNTKDDLLDTMGVKIKRQNGTELKPEQIKEIKANLEMVYQSFGDRSSMAKSWGLKISHAGETNMHASKAAGFFIPSMHAIGVSAGYGKFGFTLAHEFAHFMDNYVGGKVNKHYATDDYNSLAGRIATTFRRSLNVKTDSKYQNRTCECFARALEQHHATLHVGDDAATFGGIKYYDADNHVKKETFDAQIRPLIEQFLSENDHLLKSASSELKIIDLNNSFELVKSSFDNEEISFDKFIEYCTKYNDIVKGDPSHGGKLEKVVIMDSKGKKEVKWISKEDAKPSEKPPTNDKTKHTYAKLHEFAKDTPATELKRIINESHDEKLRKAAHRELDRREQKEKVKKDKKDKKAKK